MDYMGVLLEAKLSSSMLCLLFSLFSVSVLPFRAMRLPCLFPSKLLLTFADILSSSALGHDLARTWECTRAFGILHSSAVRVSVQSINIDERCKQFIPPLTVLLLTHVFYHGAKILNLPRIIHSWKGICGWFQQSVSESERKRQSGHGPYMNNSRPLLYFFTDLCSIIFLFSSLQMKHTLQ